MKAVAVLAEFSPDFENVLAELLSLLHHMSLAKTVPEALGEFVSARDSLLKLSEEVSAEDLQLFYQIALIGRRDLPLSPDARNGFEMILLRMLAFRPAAVQSSDAAVPVSAPVPVSVRQSQPSPSSTKSQKPAQTAVAEACEQERAELRSHLLHSSVCK